MSEMRNKYGLCSENLKERHLKDLGMDGKIILGQLFNEIRVLGCEQDFSGST
jgi:hypothetical protein